MKAPNGLPINAIFCTIAYLILKISSINKYLIENTANFSTEIAWYL